MINPAYPDRGSPGTARRRRRRVRILAQAACLGFVTLATILAAGGTGNAAGKPDPIRIGIPSGQSVTLSLDPLGITGQSGLTGTPLNSIPDFSLDLLLVQCGSSMHSDGSVWCGLDGKPVVGTAPGPAPGPSAAPSTRPTTAPATGPATAPATGPTSAPGTDPTSGPSPAATGTGSSTSPAARAAAPHTASTVTASPKHPRAAARRHGHDARDHDGPAGMSDHELLVLAASAMTMLGLVGRGGIARSSARNWRTRYPRAATGTEGEVVTPDAETYEFDPDAGGPGDRSRLWGVVAGWAVLDRISRRAPIRMATRVPLVARILADGSYLRAILGVASTALVGIGFALGIASAADTDGLPLAPSFALCAALIVVASLDATAGLAGVGGFAIGILAWGPGDLGPAASVRSFLGMAALWFAIPLIASAARPLRRSVERTGRYRWDRFADAVVAALIAGWAVMDAVNGLAGLSGRVSPVAGQVGALALCAIAGVALRVVLEEAAARLFPERLKAVDSGILPAPSPARDLLSACIRVAIFVFVSAAFLGNCWQLWVSGLLFALPEILDLAADKLPNRPMLHAVLPRGVTLVLVLLVAELLAVALAEHAFARDDLLRNAFVVMMVPECVLTLAGLFGREGPEPGRRRLYEALGVVVVALSVMLALNS